MRGPESRLTKKILDVLNRIPRTKAIKLHGSRYSVAGTPDLLVVSDGKALLLEVKTASGRTTPIQDVQLRQWRDAGALVATVRSVDDAVDVVLAPTVEDVGYGSA